MHDPITAAGPYRPTDDRPLWSVSALRKRWWLYLVLVALAVGVAMVHASRQTPSYSAQAQLLIAPLDQGSSQALPLGIRVLRDSGDPTRNLQTAVTLLSSPQIAQEAARKVRDGNTLATVQEHVTVEAVGGSNVVSITATADSPSHAAALANGYAGAAIETRNAQVSNEARTAIQAIDGKSGESYVAQREQLRTLRDQGDPTVTLSQSASLPEAPDGPPRWVVLFVAILAGGALATLVALLLERNDRGIRDRTELLQRIPVPVLTTVPTPSRGHRGIDMPATVREAFRTLQIQLDLSDRPGCRTILVTSASGGDGKTTTVLNLAFALIGAGHRVIAVDFDLRQPDLLPQLGLEDHAPGLAESLTTGASLSQIMRSAPRLPPLRVVAVTSGAGSGDVALLPALARRMQAVLAEAETQADYVLIDTAPLGEVGDALSIAEYVDDVLLVGRPGSTDRAAVETLAGLLQRADITPTGWVVTGAEAPGGRYADELESPTPVRRRRRPVA